MIRKLFFVAILLISASGCSHTQGAKSDSPGAIPWAGGKLQLMFSNPEYNADDPGAKERQIENQLYGRRDGTPGASSGIGVMGVWGY